MPVRVIQDEWANVAQPESYPKILATCRSYNIGLNIIVQNIQQIKALYEKEWESIIGNCDTLLFLGGGNEPTSLEFIVKLLGKETISTRTRGQTKGRSGSSSTNFQQTGRDLMTIDEVRKLDTHKAILFIRGEDPVLDKKYNIKRHPNIKLTTDGIRSLPEDLSPEREAVVRTACSLVGKVNYFWGGKSLVIGWDVRWGELRQVTAAGNSTTGTYRPYGLDCSGCATRSKLKRLGVKQKIRIERSRIKFHRTDIPRSGMTG